MRKRERKIYLDLTEGKVSSSLWRMALPSMGGALLLNLFSLVDLFFIGRLGYVAVAALSISGVILSILIMVGLGVSTGSTALIAHYTGKKDYHGADSVLFQTLILSVICSVVMAAAAFFWTEPILKLFGAEDKIIGPAAEYLRVTFYFSIFIFLFFAFNHALRGSGDVAVPLKMLAIANILNIILDPIFIFGLGLVPALGVAGSAVATVISRGVGLLLLLRHLIYGKSSIHFHRGVFKLNLPVMGRIVRIGFFSSLEVMLRQVSLLLLIRIITSFGVAALAAYGVVIRIRMFIIMIGFGMAGAVSALIGQNMGAGLDERSVRAGYKGLKYYEIIVLPIAVTFFIFAPYIVRFFTSQIDVVSMASVFIRVTFPALPFLALAVILGGGIAGAGDTVGFAVMTGVVRLGVMIPLAYVLALPAGLGVLGVWISFSVSDLFQGIWMLFYFKSRKWQVRYETHRALLEAAEYI